MATDMLGDVLAGLLEAALWADLDYGDDPEGVVGSGNRSDDSRDASDVNPDDVAKLRELCARFLAENADDCQEYAECRAFDPSQGSVWTYLGHDLWLTASRHGAGFWDRDLGELGDRLTTAAQSGDFARLEHTQPYTAKGEPHSGEVRFDLI